MAKEEICNQILPLNCLHCGQALKKGETRFCCSGCEMVWNILHEKGLNRYYEIKGSQLNTPVELEDDTFDYLETESFRQKWVKSTREGHYESVFFLKGIQCAACIWLIEKVLGQTSGVIDFQLFMGTGKLKLVFTEAVNLRRLARELASMGYRLGLQAGSEAEDQKRRQTEVFRLGIAGALAGNLMMFSIPLYTGGDQSSLAPMFALINFVLSLPVLTFAALPFIRKAWSSARRGLFHLDIPIVLGILGGETLSIHNLMTGDYSGIYFDSIGMLVFFLLAGRFVQSRSVEHATEQCKKLMSEMPELTEARRGETWVRIVSEEVKPGDHLRLTSGEVLAVDGKVLSEVSIWNMQVVSGESLPQRLIKGEVVPGGSINMGGLVEVEARSDVHGGSLSQLEMDANRQAISNDEVHNSRLAALFTFTTLFLAVFGVYIWWPQGPVAAFKVALTLFVVACPCALALARPTAEAFGILRASELGVWIKNSRFFSRMNDIRHVVFDKTGVLTHGEPEIVARHDFQDNQVWLESAVCALESHSDHPVATLLSRSFSKEGSWSKKKIDVTQVEVLPGRGIKGVVQGTRIWIGSFEAFFEVFEKSVDANLVTDPLGWDQNLVAVAQDGELALLLGLKDRVRDDVAPLVAWLIEQGFSLSILSGDRQEVVDALIVNNPDVVGIGGMKPHDKLHEVLRVNKSRPVLMVGDGLNDMGALAAAHIGIAAGKAAPAALRYSDAVIHVSGIGVLKQIIQLAKSVKKAIVFNIAVSLGYNAFSFYLALSGKIGPLVAAVLMPLSSLSVIGISSWIIRRNKKKWEY